MTKWLLFSAVWWVTGNPILAIIVMLLAAWAAERTFVGVLPDPLRGFRAWRQRSEWLHCIENNPVDGPCLLCLGRDAVERWRHRQAHPYLQRALERMPREPEARYLLGLAEIGCRDVEAGLVRIRALLEEQPRYRFGEPWLEVGARLLSIGEHVQARQALEGFLQIQPSSVRGHFLLGVALARGGDREGSRREKRRAWEEFLTQPRFRRKVDRRYAWRANPSRPLLYAAIAAVLSLVLGAGLWQVAPRLRQSVQPPPISDVDEGDPAP
ncbi:MAG: tetratricopeptide repeat protein [Pseudomonadota bacterium]